MELSVDSDLSKDHLEEDKIIKVTKKKERKKDKDKSVTKDETVSNGKRDSEHEQDEVPSQEKLDIPEEAPKDEIKETGFTVIGGQRKDKEVKKVQRVLPDWLAKPTIINSDFSSNVTPVEKMPYLDSHIIRKLQQHEINHLFPVQSVVIPAILSQMEINSCFGSGGYDPSDICVSAPTGSGKTLAYVLPIVQSLLKRVVCHLRALVILPTKDLANQVKQVFELFTEGTNLRVGLASGSKSFAKDQEQLVSLSSCGSSSRVDILICTPGRLVDHISSTPNFTLHHVRFLVIDEADRLLDQSYHGWLGKVLKAAYNKQSTSGFINSDRPVSCNLQTIRNPPGLQTAASFATIQLPLQKLLFSATMTHSPEKLAPLQLYQPILFTATGSVNQTNDGGDYTADVTTAGRYSIPEGLSEYMTVCNNGEKPLMVLYCLTQLKFQRVLCFVSSLEATHRLYLLVKLYGGVQAAEYSSNLTPQQRKGILRDFKLGKLQLLICSDAMARGMDIQDVLYVISYDVPNYVRSYIHRVGRTARAGNKGTAITLLHSDEVHHFKELIQKTGREKIAKYNIKEEKLQLMEEKYQDTLGQLQDAVKLESQKKSQQKGRHEVIKLLQEQFMNNVLQRNTEENS
ncbi:ATP-dependent RNA helicase ddx51 [Desmophyllum pertusum]|uniref:ATP-dependent RNA helicase n=1 Tax=Desmophyllum pertusum TaxID=174260 RepID=A0A9W9YDN0_9CNID|nr:ATP-dependent RNA helicase ddx51 [Desmophyllum pertusum]